MLSIKRVILSFAVLSLLSGPITLVQAQDEANSDATSDAANLFLPFAALQQPQAGDRNTQLIVNEVISAAESGEQGWTRERFLNAKPLDLLLASDAQVAAAEATHAQQEAQRGPAESMEGREPFAGSLELAQRLYVDQWQYLAERAATEANAAESAQAAAINAPLAADSTPINTNTATWKEYPWRAMGVLFITVPGQGDGYCTASVGYRRAIWTAGHCLYSQAHGWNTNLVFVPAFRAGATPFGQFPVTAMVSTVGWVEHEDSSYDIGMVAVGDQNGYPVGDWVGYLGYQVNVSAKQKFNAFGYPLNVLNGRYLIMCESRTTRLDPTKSPNAIGIACDMTFGSSGGPRLLKYKPQKAGAYNYVNGVNAYFYQGGPQELFAAYFGDAAKNLFAWGKDR